ncbi:exosortase A [Novosphingobium capsulatum]|uniref:Exosortase A n=1 Tax=Novosphingobium capsulatum TaxID=13688 RepID=A0ABU1MGC6_9SPHN|nr:exosortase A [Novosphingobium capsulatum]MDR6509390.1 exosortase A [Novosphingobium capsulatum]
MIAGLAAVRLENPSVGPAARHLPTRGEDHVSSLAVRDGAATGVVPWVMLGLCWLGLIGLFHADWAAMAGQWWDSSTYNHILLVPAILAWLVSMRWPALRQIAPQGWWPGLVLFAGAAFLWMLGDFAGFSLVTQTACVVMLQASFLAIIGPRLGAALLFPLAYMLFLVPFGDELIPLLQIVTARIVMVLLHLVGIPAALDGVFITTPAGYFKVAEACSGVKFLIAMVAYGVLVCQVCFRRWPRRATFMAMALIVPILANGVRAWGTIVIAGWRGIQFAAGFDHVFYGWVFFAVVMALTMLAGWPFFDRARDDPPVSVAAILADRRLAWAAGARVGQGLALGVLAALALAFVGWGAAAGRLAAPLPARIDLPAVPGWHRVAAPGGWPWQPRHGGADHRLLGRYADDAGHVVDVSFALYAGQGDGREAGGFGEGAVPPGSGWAWEKPAPSIAGGKGDMLQAPGPVHRLAITWYRTDGWLGSSNMALKLWNIADRLLLRAQPTATLILSSEDNAGAPAAPALAAFVAATGPLDRWIDTVSRGQ